MHARMTRYDGCPPDAMDEALARKKGVLPTEFGQTEGMMGDMFFMDREKGTIIIVSLWQDEAALRGSEEEATRVREEVSEPDETVSVERYEVAALNFAQT